MFARDALLVERTAAGCPTTSIGWSSEDAAPHTTSSRSAVFDRLTPTQISPLAAIPTTVLEPYADGEV